MEVLDRENSVVFYLYICVHMLPLFCFIDSAILVISCSIIGSAQSICCVLLKIILLSGFIMNDVGRECTAK